MGACTNKSKTLNLKEEQYMHLLDVNNPLNVNHKYANDITIIQNKYMGIGFKRTNQYTTNLTKQEWEKLQKSFWGREFKQYQEINKDSIHWQTIHKAITQDDENSAKTILDMRKLKMVDHSIQLIVSDKQIYQIPIFLINDPVAFNNEHLLFNFENKQLIVRIKSSKLPSNFELEMQSSSTILEIKELILKQMKEKTICRLFLNGRELNDQNQLDNSGFFVIIYIFKMVGIIYIMHKTKVQILFKCSLPHEKPQYEDTQFSLQKTLDLNQIQPVFELILEDCQLILDDHFYKSLTKLTKLIYLGLNNCRISSLKNFPKLGSLRRLTLDFNSIENHDLIYLRYYQDKLISLSLIQNKLDLSIDGTLQELYSFDQLIQLSIAGNSYNFIEKDWVKLRDDFFDNMSNLVFLDGIARGESISSLMEQQFCDQKEELEYLGRFDQSEKIGLKEYKNQ